MIERPSLPSTSKQQDTGRSRIPMDGPGDAGARVSMERPQPWEQMPGERAKAFAAFLTYRHQPRMGRSLRRVAETLERSRPLIFRWSSAYGWVDRVTAWDAEQDRLLQAEMEAERIALARRLAAQGAMLQHKGLRKVATYVDRVDRDGSPVELQRGQRYVDGIPLTFALRMVELGARLEVMGRGGLPTPEAAVEPPGTSIVVNPIIEKLSHDPSKTGRVLELMRQIDELLAPDPTLPN